MNRVIRSPAFFALAVVGVLVCFFGTIVHAQMGRGLGPVGGMGGRAMGPIGSGGLGGGLGSIGRMSNPSNMGAGRPGAPGGRPNAGSYGMHNVFDPWGNRIASIYDGRPDGLVYNHGPWGSSVNFNPYVSPWNPYFPLMP